MPAARKNLDGLPYIWIGVGSVDPFLAENEACSARLQAAGVECGLQITPGLSCLQFAVPKRRADQPL